MPSDDDKQCRICLQGHDPQLGRLIKPCKCDGSIKYVHTECLNQWRKASTSRSAFFECPQCRYRYRFARTRVVGLATSTFILSFLSLFLFTLLVYLASFIGTFILYYFDDGQEEYSTISLFFWNPITATRDLIASAVHLADDIVGDESATKLRNWSSGPPRKLPSKPGFIARFVHRFIMGLSVVGITSFAQWLWSMSLIGRMQFLNVRGLRDRRERGGGAILSVIVVGFIIAGAVRALLQVYRWVERRTQALLVRAEYSILEVGD